ncbi:MAG: hypothetical protein IPK55_13260 [Streptococcus sp.]|nr:hypothetical protein [Streptococcus sp.]
MMGKMKTLNLMMEWEWEKVKECRMFQVKFSMRNSLKIFKIKRKRNKRIRKRKRGKMMDLK